MTQPQWVLKDGEWILVAPDLSHMVGDARKRLLEELPNHDEVHAHEDVDWNLVRGED